MGQYHVHILLVLLSFIANLVLGSVSLTIDHRHRLNRSFSLLTFALAFWALMKLVIVFSSTDEGAFVFTRIGAISWTFLPALYVPIVYALVRKGDAGIRRYVPWAFTALSAVLFVCAWIPGLMFTDMRLESWGYTDMPGWVFSLVFQPYLVGSFLYMIVELVMFTAKARSYDEKAKGILVLVGLLVPLIGGTITNVLLPSMDVYVFETAIPLTTVNAAIVAWAAMRYRLLSIHVDYVSKEIITSIDEALLVLNDVGRVGIVNDAAVDLLGRERSAVVGEHMNTFLEGARFDDDFKKNVRAKTSHVWRVALRRLDGDTVETELKASELRNDRGKLVGYVLVGRKKPK
jgi:PAS domain S-box-containing protein